MEQIIGLDTHISNKKKKIFSGNCYYCSTALKEGKFKKIEKGGNGDTILSCLNCIRKMRKPKKRKLRKRI